MSRLNQRYLNYCGLNLQTPGPGQSSFMATLIKDHKAQKPETQVTPYKLITPIKNSYWWVNLMVLGLESDSLP
jgi:hypothetical protein